MAVCYSSYLQSPGCNSFTLIKALSVQAGCMLINKETSVQFSSSSPHPGVPYIPICVCLSFNQIPPPKSQRYRFFMKQNYLHKDSHFYSSLIQTDLSPFEYSESDFIFSSIDTRWQFCQMKYVQEYMYSPNVQNLQQLAFFLNRYPTSIFQSHPFTTISVALGQALPCMGHAAEAIGFGLNRICTEFRHSLDSLQIRRKKLKPNTSHFCQSLLIKCKQQFVSRGAA